ncbi:hypothetical protein Tco_0543842 [Tanacetum coccineum]
MTRILRTQELRGASSSSTTIDDDEEMFSLSRVFAAELSDTSGEHRQYLRDKVTPLLLTNLEIEIELLEQVSGIPKDFDFEKITGVIERVKLMLEEYNKAQEIVREGMPTASLLKRQAKELKEATILQTSSAIRHISNIDNMYIKSYSFSLFSSLPVSHSLWSSQSFGHQKAINGFDMPLPVAVCSGLVNPLAPRKGKFHGGLITMSTLCT